MAQPVTIIGAGIGGLTLGRVLRSRGVPVVLYERAKPGPKHTYSILLQSWAFEPLLKLLNLDLATFRERTSLGRGPPFHNAIAPKAFRVHHAKLEGVLAEGLDIRNEHNLKNVTPGKQGVRLEFENDEKIDASRVVAADGAMSTTRKLIFPECTPAVHPFVVTNGRRWLNSSESQRVASTFRSDVLSAEHRQGDILLETHINEYDGDRINVSFTYSRHSRSGQDPLHKPDRDNSGAKQIPPELFEELGQLLDLPEPFKTVFSVEAVKESRLLHWLMRSALVPKQQLLQRSDDNLVLMGDCVHTTPILGSIGANIAVADALQLGESFTNENSFKTFYESRYEVWSNEARGSVERLQNLHEGNVIATL